ncbi:MAG: hypothetical protein V1827_01670 [Candidatus Micrarchaeota archaeon]
MRWMLFLLLLPVCFSAQCAANVFDDIFTGDSGMMIGAAIALTTLIIAILYMAGSATHNAELTVMAKDEIFHLLFSIFLIFSVVGIMLFSCQTLGSFLDFVLGPSGLGLMSPDGCYTGIESPQSVAQCYLSDVVKTTQSGMTRMMKESLSNEMDSTLVVSIYNPITGGVSIPYGAYRKAYAMQLDMVANNFMLPALISLQTQKLVLLIAIDIIKWLLPVALLLRVLPVSRHFGNMLIALAVALYVIVPTLYALNGAMDQVVFSECPSYSEVIDDQIMGGCDSDTSFWLVARALPQAFFLPNLTIALTVTFLGGISKALKVLG